MTPLVRPLRAVVVVVPAHDEEELLDRCLRAVGVARDELAARRPDVTTRLVVVLDRCADGSPDIARHHDAECVAVDARAVGTARRVGVERAVALTRGIPTAGTWISSTDADSVVPADWLLDQVRSAERGAQVVVGSVVPDRQDLSVEVHDAWVERHLDVEMTRHVHGANLGVRLDAYLAVGGFESVTEHEDVRLVAALAHLGVPMTGGSSVTTSGRAVGRAPGGFAGYLRALAATLGPLDAIT